MGIDWESIFYGIGRGMESFGGYLTEQERDKREHAQAKEMAQHASDLEAEREKSRREFSTTLAKDMANMEHSLRLKEKETGYVFDTLGLDLGRQYTAVWQLPEGDPRKQEVLGKIDFSSMLLAEAKAGKVDFTTEELEGLSPDFRLKFTSIIQDNQRFEQSRQLNEANINSQMELRKAQELSAKGQLEYFKHLRQTGEPVDRLKHLKERQRQLGVIDSIKSTDYYGYIQKGLAEGQRPEDLAQANPVQWSAFLRGEQLIKEAGSIALQQGLLGGMSPKELGLTRPEPPPDEPEVEGKQPGIKATWAIEAGAKEVAKRVPGAKTLEKAISPIAARGKDVDRALTIGLKIAKKKYGASVMSYEQAMDLKENRPGAANKQRFVAIDPTTRQVAVFEFYIKNGQLKARKVG